MMNAIIPPDKSYFRIREVSRILEVEPSVLRFWEGEFKSVKPIRTKTDQRLYRRQDVQELLTIKSLLYEEFFTIKGAKRQLLLRKTRHGAKPEDSTLKRKLETIKEGLLQIRELLENRTK